MKISLGYSPCPNDTFIFDAMVHGKIDTEGLIFEPKLADVEALNRWAFAGELDVTKLSYHAYAHLRERYALLQETLQLNLSAYPAGLYYLIVETGDTRSSGRLIRIDD